MKIAQDCVHVRIRRIDRLLYECQYKDPFQWIRYDDCHTIYIGVKMIHNESAY